MQQVIQIDKPVDLNDIKWHFKPKYNDTVISGLEYRNGVLTFTEFDCDGPVVLQLDNFKQT